jgi:hypothetical protein
MAVSKYKEVDSSVSSGGFVQLEYMQRTRTGILWTRGERLQAFQGFPGKLLFQSRVYRRYQHTSRGLCVTVRDVCVRVCVCVCL